MEHRGGVAVVADALVGGGQPPQGAQAHEGDERPWCASLELAQQVDEPEEGEPLDPLHHEEVAVVVDPEVVDLHHVRVDDPRADARLFDEHGAEVLVVDEGLLDPLDADGALEAGGAALDRVPDGGHAPRSGDTYQLVAFGDEGPGRVHEGPTLAASRRGREPLAPPEPAAALAPARRPRGADGRGASGIDRSAGVTMKGFRSDETLLPLGSAASRQTLVIS